MEIYSRIGFNPSPPAPLPKGEGRVNLIFLYPLPLGEGGPPDGGPGEGVTKLTTLRTGNVMPATIPIEKDAAKLSRQEGELHLLYQMLLIRRFEERASQAYQQQKIGGFCHLYIGQEAVVVGALAATRNDDYVITAYRDHAHAIARGTSLNACMAELL